VNLSLLGQARLWTVAAGAIAVPLLGLLVSWPFALGCAVTIVWAVLGFWVLEKLMRAFVVPPGTPRNVFAVILWSMLKLGVYAVAIWVLIVRAFPPVSHIVGVTILLVVLVALGAAKSPHLTRQMPARRGEDG